MKTKKLLSLLLALMMMLSVVPMYASAAEPIALSASNVTEWPTANGEIYVGQILGEHITLVGGKVIYEGVEVPGHFEHFTPNISVSLASEVTKANLKFVPDDTTTYKGFNKLMSTDVTYAVKKTTPILLNENNPPIATKIKEGQKLAESTISGGVMKNPYNDKVDISSRVWQWDNPDLVVTESGKYLAKWEGDTRGYEIVTEYIYVEVEKDQKATALKTMPTVNFDYNPQFTWGEYSFDSAIAVVSGTDIEVPGTFSIIETKTDKVPNAGTYEVEVVFTPDDTESYIGFTTNVAVTVNAIPISFIDNEGNVVEDFAFEVEPGTKMNDIKALITTNLRVPKNAIISVEDNNAYAQNGRKYKLTINHDDRNYVGKELYFTVKFKNVELTPTITAIGLNAFKVNCGDYKPAGTFTITCNGEEITVTKANQDFACEVWTDNGGTYEIKAKYNPAENDYFIISDAEWAITVYAKRNLKASAMTYTVNGDAYASEIRANDIIVAKTSYEDFAHYVIKDGSGKEIVLEGVDITSREITFAMPDHDLTIEIKTNKEIEMEEAAANCDHICHNDNPLFQMLWKVLTFIFRLFDVQQYCDCGNLHYDAPFFG